MRVTTKGQVTIPKDIRDRLGIGPGSEVEFVEGAGGVVELVKGIDDPSADGTRLRGLDAWFRRVEGTGDSGLTADEIMAMTRDRDDRDHR